jgi:ethanolamine-phosphate cytidylyltransferase
MMHYGHMNAFRQAKALGTFLVVGVNSSESIARCKGPPVMNDEERLSTVVCHSRVSIVLA